MLNMTRTRLIQIWFAAVALVVVAGLALGATMTMATGTLLVALCLAPPVIIKMLWPGSQPQTIAEVLHDADAKK